MANALRQWVRKIMGVKTPIEQGVVDALVVQPTRNTVSNAGPGTWMGPGQPLEPQQQAIAGRQFDFPYGINMQYTPRATELNSFSQLRSLADNYDLLRLLIETRKDQLVKFEWSVVPIDQSKKPDDRCKEIQTFLKFPDRHQNWQTWIRSLVEDMLVIDAATIYPRMTRGGGVYALDLMDGATIKPVLDESGRVPDPPDPAYQQIIKGLPAVNYSHDELIYAPRNRRTHKIYGYSPVEQIIMTVNIALRRQLHQLQFYTEGNIPEALITVPASWTVEQIQQYQEYWDSLMEGNTAARRHLKFIPDGNKYIETKPEVKKDQFDEWLARVCCYAFSIPPQAFVKEMNRATSESAKEQALEEGLIPLLQWIGDSLNLLIWKYWGYEDLQFRWQDDEPVDAMKIAEIHDIYLRNGSVSVDEVRSELGRPAIGMPNAIYTGMGATLIRDVLKPPMLGVNTPTNAPGLMAAKPNSGALPKPEETERSKQTEGAV